MDDGGRGHGDRGGAQEMKEDKEEEDREQELLKKEDVHEGQIPKEEDDGRRGW